MSISQLTHFVNDGILRNYLPVWDFSYRPFRDMAQLSFNSHEREYVNKGRVGQYFRLSHSPVTRYSLNIALDHRMGVRFTWKDQLKPLNAAEIEAVLTQAVLSK